jgi:putative DNA primase/helicase
VELGRVEAMGIYGTAQQRPIRSYKGTGKMTTKTQRKPQDAKLDERLFSRAAEIAVIDSIVKDPACFVPVAKIIGPNSFAFSENKIIYQVLLDLKESEKPINKLMLQDALQENNLLDKIGGEEYFRKVVGNVCTAANAEYYANIVREKAQRRRTVETVDNMQKTLESDRPVGESILQIQQLAAGLDGAVEAYTSMPIIRNLDGVEVKAITWLWRNKIPLSMLTLIVGDPGLGKSFLSLCLAARISRGENWPDGDGIPDNRAPLGTVILLTAEDPLEQVIKPRLISLGADTKNIDAIEAVRVRDDDGRQRQEFFNLQRDIPALQQAIRPNTKLIIIDPLSAYLGNGLDAHRDNDVRGVLSPLCAIAEKNNIAVVGVMHLNKNTTGKAVYRALGSIAFLAAARTVWMVTTDPNDPDSKRRLLTPAKHNVLIDPTGLGFEITDGKIVFEDGPVNMSSDEALGIPSSIVAAPERERAAQWLRDTLTGHSVATVEVERMAVENGITLSTLRRARNELRVVSYPLKQPDGKRVYMLRLPDDHQQR